MNAKKVASFLMGIGVSKQFRNEMDKAPEKALGAMGFDAAEIAAIKTEMDAVPDVVGQSGGPDEPDENFAGCCVPVG